LYLIVSDNLRFTCTIPASSSFFSHAVTMESTATMPRNAGCSTCIHQPRRYHHPIHQISLRIDLRLARKRAYGCVLGALAKGRWKCIVGWAKLGTATAEGGGANVKIPDAEAAVRVAEADVHGQVVLEIRWLICGEVEGGEDGRIDGRVEVVGAVEKPEDDDH